MNVQGQNFDEHMGTGDHFFSEAILAHGTVQPRRSSKSLGVQRCHDPIGGDGNDCAR
jgi:hypothetical protein